ncbi:MAG: hypothetical protein JW750_11505 [Anaerolineaceae bacterium]|nr:hypothetical protein [Anaerolineaceae bacterium]
MTIQNFDDFTTALLEAGFSMGGGNSEGVYSVSGQYDACIVYHTGNPETDPWEWRMRVMEERDDIAYAKLFFRKSGWITKEWYPCFLAARRGGRTFDEEYRSGAISYEAKRIYECVRVNEVLPVHLIKQLAGFGREDKSRFDRALIDLQMKMYLTMCGRQQKTSLAGKDYGWFSTTFTTTENFFGGSVFTQAAQITEQEAVERITARIFRLNPDAQPKKIEKFIRG